MIISLKQSHNGYGRTEIATAPISSGPRDDRTLGARPPGPPVWDEGGDKPRPYDDDLPWSAVGVMQSRTG